jgi:hypothetical protein
MRFTLVTYGSDLSPIYVGLGAASSFTRQSTLTKIVSVS